MDFLLRQSIGVIPIAAVATPLWLALAILAVAAVVASRRGGAVKTARFRLAWVIETGTLIVIISDHDAGNCKSNAGSQYIR
jgi:hypothetical protein